MTRNFFSNLLIGVIFIYSCSTEEMTPNESYYCVDCSEHDVSETFSINDDLTASFQIPNIILSGFEESTIFPISYKFYDIDNNELIITPDSISLQISNDSTINLFQTDIVDFNEEHSFLSLWNGMQNGQEYIGDFSFDLKIFFPGDQFYFVLGTASAITCAEIENCENKLNGDCDFEACIYHFNINQQISNPFFPC